MGSTLHSLIQQRQEAIATLKAVNKILKDKYFRDYPNIIWSAKYSFARKMNRIKQLNKMIIMEWQYDAYVWDNLDAHPYHTELLY